MKALRILAGPEAARHLRQQGLRPDDVRVVPAAAGGPKGLVLNPLDRFLFGHWLDGASPGSADAPPVHLLGASIGAWRMAAACDPDPDAALAQMAEDYVLQAYPHAPGRLPTAATVSAVFRQMLADRLQGRAAALLAHPRRRLHVFTARGRGLLHRADGARAAAGYLAATLANAAARRALGGFLERVVFADPRGAPPLPLADLPTRQVALDADNLVDALLASCSIPFVLRPVADPAGAPSGHYWDGGLTDYHFGLDYGDAGGGLVLYPHFHDRLIPGWLDKAWRGRHRTTPGQGRVLLLAPRADWVAGLPGGKLPDRGDFKAYGDDHAARQRAWRAAIAESQRLADEFAAWLQAGRFETEPLR